MIKVECENTMYDICDVNIIEGKYIDFYCTGIEKKIRMRLDEEGYVISEGILIDRDEP